MVKCRLGEERATVMQLMRKVIAFQNTDSPLQIKSVVSPEHVKGYIYIEAYKQTHVKNAIENVRNLAMGAYKQQMVPVNEMPDVLRVVKDQPVMKKNSWVRLKRGLYKDDLAQVDYADISQNMCHLKLIPRIDYSRQRGMGKSSEDDGKKKRKFGGGGKRPPAKLFDADAVRAVGGEIAHDGDFLVFEGNRYSRKGFLYKNFNVNAIISEGK
jgi:transcription elongation factor SPT5